MTLRADILRWSKGSFFRAVRAVGRSMLRTQGADLSRHSLIIAEATYSPWLADASFRDTFAQVSANTLVGEQRCYELWHLVEQVQHLNGDLIEVGVWRGGTGALLAKKAQIEGFDATVFLCDTFEGVVKAGSRDPTYRGGEHADVTRRVVEDLVRSMGLNNVEILSGVFPDDTGAAIEDARTFRLCHIDVDVYRSARDVLEWVWDRLEPGGMVVFDDFGFFQCEGVTALVNEEAAKPDRIVIQNLNGHGIMIKRHGAE